MIQFQEKPHYHVLDALRGVAALMVLVFHIFDACYNNIFPHGYLAVDFFFILSGFVIGYAYDSRWSEGLTVGGYFKRRLIRLHPMVLVGGLIGGIIFIALGCARLDGTPVPLHLALIATLMTMLTIPTLPGSPLEVRGFGEFFPLNGPVWSLFYEYIGNILYALVFRKLSTKALAMVSSVSGTFVLLAAIRNGYVGVGWSAADWGWWDGFVRMVFPYTMGMLMARTIRPGRIRHAFLWCSAAILGVGLIPVIGGSTNPWLNGFYDFFCIAAVFPVIVWVGASDCSAPERLCRGLGDLSYPLYTIHYPFMCILFSIIGFKGELFDKSAVYPYWPAAAGIAAFCILLAWLLMKYYDRPVRRWLTDHWK
jgi:peptidoglycan/LPS O-acetylase OafA/YrhL